MIVQKIKDLNQNHFFVDSAKSVKAALMKDIGLEATESEIQKVMREDLGMRFRKVLPISIHGNSDKNLVLRQQFAKMMITLLLQGKTIISTDESWIGMSDFRRRKWQVPGTTNSIPQLRVADRISMISALDSNGSVYLSLLQSNSNGKVMDIYFRQLALQLDKERPQWR
mgnify:CR=1 FL=1